MPKIRTLIQFSGLAVSTGLLVLNSQAAVFLSSAAPHATGPTHEFYTSVGYTYVSDWYSLSFGDSTAHLAGDNSVSITLSAPAGQMFVVQSPPADYSSASLEFYVLYGGDEINSPYATISNPSHTFVVINGSTPASEFTQANLPKFTGNQLDASATASVTSSFSFTSVTFSFDYDNADITDAPLGSFNLGVLNYVVSFEGSEHADPGALLGLEPIPEPALTGVIAVSLLAAVVGGRTWRLRRRAA